MVHLRSLRFFRPAISPTEILMLSACRSTLRLRHMKAKTTSFRGNTRRTTRQYRIAHRPQRTRAGQEGRARALSNHDAHVHNIHVNRDVWKTLPVSPTVLDCPLPAHFDECPPPLRTGLVFCCFTLPTYGIIITTCDVFSRPLTTFDTTPTRCHYLYTSSF